MIKYLIPLFVITTLVHQICFAGTDSLWSAIYGAKGGDIFHSIAAVDSTGFMICGGSPLLTDDGWTKAYIMRVNSTGDSIWAKSYQGNDLEKIISVSNGRFAAVGRISVNVWFLLIDSLGNVLASKNYGGVDREWGTDISETLDGGFIISGYKTTESGTDIGLDDAFIIKTDSSGNVEWNYYFGDSLHTEDAYSILQTDDGSFYFIGNKNGGSWSDSGLIQLTKIDTAGNLLWSKTYKGLGYARGYALSRSISGNLLLAGESGLVGQSVTGSAYAIYVDSSGTVLWEKKYDGSTLWGITHLQDDCFLLIGGRIIKIDTAGTQLWDKTIQKIGRYDGGRVSSCIETADKSLVFAGWLTDMHYGTNENFWIFNTDSAGNYNFQNVKNRVGIKHINTGGNRTPHPSTFSNGLNIPNAITPCAIAIYTLKGELIGRCNFQNGKPLQAPAPSRSGLFLFHVFSKESDYWGSRTIIK